MRSIWWLRSAIENRCRNLWSFISKITWILEIFLLPWEQRPAMYWITLDSRRMRKAFIFVWSHVPPGKPWKRDCRRNWKLMCPGRELSFWYRLAVLAENISWNLCWENRNSRKGRRQRWRRQNMSWSLQLPITDTIRRWCVRQKKAEPPGERFFTGKVSEWNGQNSFSAYRWFPKKKLY